MMQFWGLVLHMGIVKKPEIRQYWSVDILYNTPVFRMVMVRTRFEAIHKFLHYNDNARCPARDDPNFDRLFKVRPVIEHFSKKFAEVYVPKRDICVDESLVHFKGRLRFRQYLPSKRARYGIKLYKLCESTSGYTYSFRVYEGKDSRIEPPECPSILGHPTLQIPLCARYRSLRYFRKNQRGLPKTLLGQMLRKGESKAQCSDHLLVVKYKDKRDVLLLTTIHGDGSALSSVRGTSTQVCKPDCVLGYNKNMGGVDVSDQLLQPYSALRKAKVWYKKLSVYIVQMAMLNAFLLSRCARHTDTSYLQFQEGGALLGGVNALHTAFPENPLEQYQMQCELLLDRLGLHNILQEELQRLGRQQNEESDQSETNISNCFVEDNVHPHSSQQGYSIVKIYPETTRISDTQTSPEVTLDNDQKCPDVSYPLQKKSRESNQQAETSMKTSNDQTSSLSENHTSMCSDSSLGWYDSISSEQKTLEVSPIPKTAESYTGIKLQPGIQPGLGEISNSDKGAVPGEAEGKIQPGKDSSHTRVNHLPNEVITEHVSKKWQRLNKKSLKSALGSKQCGESSDVSGADNPLSSGPLHSTPARGKKRSRLQADPEESRSGEQDPEMYARLAQLAKFTFQQKTKMTRCPERENINKESRDGGDDQPKPEAAPAGKLLRLLAGSVTADQRGSLPMKEAKDLSGATITEKEVQNKTSAVSHVLPPPACSGEVSHCRKVSSSTLAKLATFSFSSVSDNKAAEVLAVPCNNAPKSPENQLSGGKRKCFQLDPPFSRTAITCRTLFSTTDLDDETLDFDWSNEVK
ncbi:unnamed protein product [Ranitomeya imitator]|uniref:PiggyBac transposable element-derived protein domain-containing protein n=1 Tax=Ranitomeya imitator TaxID=111125 RepID=A0ABN9LB02_9NEOB|nr:unnamed protein product [Ranitomeya imitator]